MAETLAAASKKVQQKPAPDRMFTGLEAASHGRFRSFRTSAISFFSSYLTRQLATHCIANS